MPSLDPEKSWPEVGRRERSHGPEQVKIEHTTRRVPQGMHPLGETVVKRIADSGELERVKHPRDEVGLKAYDPRQDAVNSCARIGRHAATLLQVKLKKAHLELN